MKLEDFYNAVCKKADVENLEIGAADVKRVLACMFDLLEDLSPLDAMSVLTQGLGQAGERRR